MSDKAVRAIYWIGAISALIAPAVAMRFTSEVNWTPGDFMFAGVMLLTVGAAMELTLRSPNVAFRLATAVAVGTVFVTVWANGAVGIAGSEADPVNLFWYLPPFVAFAASILARFEARGLSRAMLAAGAVQALTTGVVALSVEGGWPIDGLIAGGVFTALWLIAGRLYAAADRQSTASAVAA